MRPVIPRALHLRERTEREKVCGAHIGPALVGHEAEVKPKGKGSDHVEEGRSCCRMRRIVEMGKNR